MICVTRITSNRPTPYNTRAWGAYLKLARQEATEKLKLEREQRRKK